MKPDIVLCDIMMPVLDGYGVYQIISKNEALQHIPFIFLSAKSERNDLRKGMEMGADDYVTKPYSTRELLARMKAVLRRGAEPQAAEHGLLKAGPVVMDIERHVVTVNGEKVQMPLKEFELLELLMENVNRVLTRGQIIDRVWGSNYFGDTKTLDVHVKRIRSKIEEDPARPRHLMTVRGLGYKFEI